MARRCTGELLLALAALASGAATQAAAGPVLLGRTETWDGARLEIADPASVSLGTAPGSVFVSDATSRSLGDRFDPNVWEIDLVSRRVSRAIDIGPFTQEPAGLTYHAGRGTLFITDDDELMLHELDRDGRHLRSFELGGLGARDPEGITSDGEQLFIADGRGHQILVVSLQGELLRSIPLDEDVVPNAEGIAIDAGTGRLFIVDDDPPTLFELDAEGRLVGAYDLSVLGIVSPEGVSMAHPAAPETTAHTRLLIADELVNQQRDGRIVEVALIRRPAGGRLLVSMVGDADGFGFRGEEPGFASSDLDRNGRLERGERLPLHSGGATPDRRDPQDASATNAQHIVSAAAPLSFVHELPLEGATPVWGRLTLTIADARALALERNLIRADGILVGEVRGTSDRRLTPGSIVETAVELPPSVLDALRDGRLRIEIARPEGQGSDDLWLDYSRLEVALSD